MKAIAVLAVSVTLLMGQSDQPAPKAAPHTVVAVRHWSLSDVTRVAVEVSGPFEFRTDRLHNPERVYFDIPNSHPRIDSRRIYTEEINDQLLQRIRVAETSRETTRVVLDLMGNVDATTSTLTNPNRLIVELRMGTGMGIPAGAPTDSSGRPAGQKPLGNPPGTVKPLAPPPAKTPETAPSKASPKTEVARTEVPAAASGAGKPDLSGHPLGQKPLASAPGIGKPAAATPAVSAPTPAPAPGKAPGRTEVARAEAPAPGTAPDASKPEAAAVDTAPPLPPVVPPEEIGKAARHTSAGSNSLIRAMGLKINRVVIDPGHGGHDQGTEGSRGLVEKELVLDVALRVGQLVQDRMGAEVIYTRTDDTFVPLEGRTALANEKKADLFLSIHANSSPIPQIAGVETFYLNINGSKEAMDVAARENASAQTSIFELQDLIRKITLHDKSEESLEFAKRVQASLYSLSARNFPAAKDRGVKSAPFVVLIGANMPSVLAEIGFVSNSREESLLKKPDYRQKVAEAVYKGMEKYAQGLSHFQVAASR
jgi:N-acetylmuramoyl-L-alanine amidase